ncbi:NAD(P)-dependent dehydrogenase (short-subunit alcohol dehydrogenase family) [Pseudarthrobacter oxydans]|uniref:SDR family oxidoreductase n=1 Tax=Pseudarthrobacter oxydans TaxID=1671 RepID=UPI002789FDC8|nr:SDR family oxidoreductase [Pseudarthrobacter oxydans]MDP9984820.1 NAD(P)-dependent dehydrogenase (short-subunit alcohol dehydrogenase family) [Pseudarthrobacter oxydans]
MTAPLILAQELGRHMGAASLTPLGRNGAHGDIASVVAFLLSPEAAFITGASIVIDGGYSGVDYYMKQESDLLG